MELLEQRRADRYAVRLQRRVLAALLVASALLGAVTGFALGARGRHTPATRAAAEGTRTAHATPECTSAVARASQGFSYAVKVGRAFVQQAQVMEQLRQQQISVDHAVESGHEVAVKGADAAARFDEALAGYLRVVNLCQLENQ